jgi:hypothetical protein
MRYVLSPIVQKLLHFKMLFNFWVTAPWVLKLSFRSMNSTFRALHSKSTMYRSNDRSELTLRINHLNSWKT